MILIYTKDEEVVEVVDDTTGQSLNFEVQELETFYAVVRIEAIDEEDEKKEDFANEYEFACDEAENYLEELEEKKQLIQSGYVGNQYYLETKSKNQINKFRAMLQESIKELEKEFTINIEWDYYPDWAEEIKNQEEEEDE
jgi:dTDP-4-amino-4,6-dideoxygalactose transaminase